MTTHVLLPEGLEAEVVFGTTWRPFGWPPFFGAFSE